MISTCKKHKHEYHSWSRRFSVLWAACGYRECIALMIYGAICNNIEFYSTMCGIFNMVVCILL
jgi:hypothetical protein